MQSKYLTNCPTTTKKEEGERGERERETGGKRNTEQLKGLCNLTAVFCQNYPKIAYKIGLKLTHPQKDLIKINNYSIGRREDTLSQVIPYFDPWKKYLLKILINILPRKSAIN